MDTHRERLLRLATEAREAHGLDRQDDFVEATGLSRSTVHRFEQGEVVSETTLRKVSQAIGWTPTSAQDVLAGGEPTLAEASEGDLRDRYKRVTLSQEGLSQAFDHALYEAFIVAAPNASFIQIDKAVARAFEVLRADGVQVARRHRGSKSGSSEGA